MKRYLSYYAVQWVRCRRTRYKKILDYTVQKAFGSIILSKLTEAWAINYSKLKRIFRVSLFYKVTLFQSLLTRWAKAEFEVFSQRSIHSNQRRQSLPGPQSLKIKSESEGKFSIPIEIKLFYLRKFINIRIVKYIKKYKRFKENFNLVHRQNKRNCLEFKNSELSEYPTPPQRVNIWDEFDVNKLKKVINFAIKDKAQWKNILYGKFGKYEKELKRRLSHDLNILNTDL